jgi:hypothetical protein
LSSVPKEKSPARKSSIELHRELVPLSEAAAVAYHVITEKPESLADARELGDVRGLVAIALSTVSPILKVDDGEARPLSSAQIEERLFFPAAQGLRDRRSVPDFSALYIRRGDLVRAIETLKQAHISFGREDVLAALKRS